MARKFGPFDTSSFYEVENRRLQRALAKASVPTGFTDITQGLVTAGTGAELVIAAYPDGALVDGLYVENPTSETVTLATNSGSTNPRIDRLVLRLDMAAKSIAPFQIQGTPAPSPSAPSLRREANVFDLPLCRFQLPGSASAQNPTNIVDERVPAAGSALIFAGQGIAYGPTPTSDQPAIIKVLSQVVDTNSNGDSTVVYPGAPFPNGVASVVPSSGDVIAGTHASVGVISVGIDSVNLRHYQPNGAPCAGVKVRVNLTVTGW